MDRKVIDGFLHLFAILTPWIGSNVRTYIDLKVINQGIGDGSAAIFQWFGRQLKVVQTGKVQQYMLAGLIVVVAVFFYFIFAMR